MTDHITDSLRVDLLDDDNNDDDHDDGGHTGLTPQKLKAHDAAMMTTPALRKQERHTHMRMVAALSLGVVAFGVADRVTYKVMLVPLERYPYFISQVSSILYVLLYWPLYWWTSRGAGVPLLAPLKRYWKFFLLMGIMDGLADVLGLVAARHLPGTLLTLLPKVIIPMTMIASMCILGLRYSVKQVGAAAIVLCGVGIALIPTFVNGDSSAPGTSQGLLVACVCIYLASVAPSAVSFVLKELVFRKEPALNVFAVSLYGSMFQLLTAVCILPLSAVPDFGEVPLSSLPSYFVAGVKCWVGIAPVGAAPSACQDDPWIPLLYHAMNLSWNVCLIFLLKRGGATLLFVVNSLKFPLSNLAFGISWPLLAAEPQAFSWYNLGGLLVELVGVTSYQYLSLKSNQSPTFSSAKKGSMTPLQPIAVYLGDSETVVGDS